METYYVEIRFKVEASSQKEADEKLDGVINSKYYDEVTHTWQD